MPEWFEIRISINPEIEESISNYLFDNGCIGSFINDDLLFAYFKKNEWDQIKLQELKNYLNELTALGFHTDVQNIGVSELADQDWNAMWKETLKPIYVLPDLIIKPSGTQFIPPKNAIVIEIDPQMAFGTGAHATTQLVLKLMNFYIQHNQKVLDIGTGSGILAITAAKLKNTTVVACDVDPIATFTAKVNIHKNSVSKNVHLFIGTIDCIAHSSFDVILANINRKEILNLLLKISNMLKPEGVLILSGILIDEEEIIIKTLNDLKFKILMKMQQEEWLGMVVGNV